MGRDGCWHQGRFLSAGYTAHKTSSGQVVLSYRGEDLDNDTILEHLDGVFHMARDAPGVTGGGFVFYAIDREDHVTGYQISGLLVWMGVKREVAPAA